MATHRFDPFGYADTTAEAQRVLLVDGDGAPLDPGSSEDEHSTTITRLTAGADRSIPAGCTSYTVTVVAAASGASPTLDGVALPEGFSVSVWAPGNGTLAAAEIATVAGDDVVVIEVS